MVIVRLMEPQLQPDIAVSGDRAAPAPRRSRSRTSSTHRRAITAIAATAGLAAIAFATGAPTGLSMVDAGYRGGFTALVAFAASRSRRWPWTVLAGAATVLAPNPVFLALGCIATVLAVVGVTRPRHRVVGAAIGALAVQNFLHLDLPGPHGLESVVAGIAAAPVLASAYTVLDRDTQRLLRRWLRRTGIATVVALALAGLALAAARPHLVAGLAAADTASTELRSGEITAATAPLDRAADRLGAANAWLASPLAMPARLIPVVGQNLGVALVATGEAEALSVASAEVTTTVNLDRLRPSGGRIDLAALDPIAAPLERLALGVDRAATRLGDARNPWLVPPLAEPLDRVYGELSGSASSLHTAALAARSAPSLLGREAPRTYAVLFTTPAEARGLGGFVGSWVILEADSGKVSLVETGRANDLNVILRGQPAPPVGSQDYIDRWGRFSPQTHVQDVTMAPDFPTVAAVTAELLDRAGRPVDGVFSIDPEALAALLQLTGPVDLPRSGRRLAANNAAQFLLVDQYVEFAADDAQRELVLEEAAGAVFARLLSADLAAPAVVADVLGPVVAEGRLMGWVPGDDELFAAAGLDGAFPTPTGTDLLSVRHQNSANNKIDAYLRRTIDYRAVVAADGAVAATVNVVLENTAPGSGLPPSVIGSNDQGLPLGTNRQYLSIYSPLDLVGATVDGRPVTLETNHEFGWRVYSTFVTIDAASSVQLEVELAGRVDPDYSLELITQPLVNDDLVSIEVLDASGATLLDRDSSPAPGRTTYSAPSGSSAEPKSR